MQLGKGSAARNGDLGAFEQLVRQHQSEVFELALRLTGNHADASAVAQEAFVQLYAAIARISNLAHLRHWLLRAVAQRAVDRPWQPSDRPESAPVPTDPGEEFTARVMARVELRWSHRREDFAPRNAGSQRGWRRIIIALGVAAIGGAAVMLAPWMPGAGEKPESAAVAGPATSVLSDTPPSEAPPDALTAAPAVAAMRAAALPDSPRHYTVIVLPPRHDSRDANAIAPLEAFHAALLAELRKGPDVALLIPGVTAPPDAPRAADYLLEVASLEERKLASGGTAFRIADPRGERSLSAGSTLPGPHWPVEIRIQPLGKLPSAGFSSVLQISDDNASLLPLAAKQIGALRLRMFPDVAMKQQLLAKTRDTSLSDAERSDALADLLGTHDQGPVTLDSVEIGVIVAGTAAMPAGDRARLLRNLRGNAHAELVETLLDALRRDADTNVRFEALATLAADYGADARVRAAIESASQGDAAPVVRMAARRVRSGDAEWRRYLLATLSDTKLPLAERVAPLILARESAITPAETSSMRGIMIDEEITAALVGIVRDSWFDYSQVSTIGDALDLLANSGNGAAPDLLVEIPHDASRAATMVASLPAPQISPAALTWLQKNRNNPRARRILEDIARGRTNPQTGFMIEQMMQQPPLPRRQN
jgi:hypothetical protein